MVSPISNTNNEKIPYWIFASTDSTSGIMIVQDTFLMDTLEKLLEILGGNCDAAFYRSWKEEKNE